MSLSLLAGSSSSSSGGGFITAPRYIFVAGRYYHPLDTKVANDTYTPPAEFVTLPPPMWLPAGQAFDRIGIECTTAQSGGTGHLAVYRAGTNGMPSTRVVDGGSISTATTGIKENTISWTVAADDIYYPVLVSHTGSVAFKGLTGPNLYGHPANSLQNLLNSLRATDASWASGFPASFPSVTWGDDNKAPLVYLRAA